MSVPVIDVRAPDVLDPGPGGDPYGPRLRRGGPHDIVKRGFVSIPNVRNRRAAVLPHTVVPPQCEEITSDHHQLGGGLHADPEGRLRDPVPGAELPSLPVPV